MYTSGTFLDLFRHFLYRQVVEPSVPFKLKHASAGIEHWIFYLTRLECQTRNHTLIIPKHYV